MNRNGQEEYIDVGKLLRTLWRHIALILAVGAIGATVAFLYALVLVPAKYEASVLFYIDNSNNVQNSAMKISTTELYAANELVDTYIAILQSRANLEEVIRLSGSEYTYEQLSGMITAKAVNSTGLFRVAVRSTNPEEARELANVVADELPRKITSIVANSSVEPIDYAVTPRTRVSPSYIGFAAAGLAVGALVTAIILALKELFDGLIRDEDYLLQTYELPILATIPDLRRRVSGKYGYYGANARKSDSASPRKAEEKE